MISKRIIFAWFRSFDLDTKVLRSGYNLQLDVFCVIFNNALTQALQVIVLYTTSYLSAPIHIHNHTRKAHYDETSTICNARGLEPTFFNSLFFLVSESYSLICHKISLSILLRISLAFATPRIRVVRKRFTCETRFTVRLGKSLSDKGSGDNALSPATGTEIGSANVAKESHHSPRAFGSNWFRQFRYRYTFLARNLRNDLAFVQLPTCNCLQQSLRAFSAVFTLKRIATKKLFQYIISILSISSSSNTALSNPVCEAFLYSEDFIFPGVSLNTYFRSLFASTYRHAHLNRY